MKLISSQISTIIIQILFVLTATHLASAISSPPFKEQQYQLNVSIQISNTSNHQTVFLFNRTDASSNEPLAITNITPTIAHPMFSLIQIDSSVLLRLNKNFPTTQNVNYVLKINSSQVHDVNVTLLQTVKTTNRPVTAKYTIDYILKLFDNSTHGLIKNDMSVLVAAIVRVLANQTILVNKSTNSYFDVRAISSTYYMVKLTQRITELFNGSDADNTANPEIDLVLETSLPDELIKLKFRAVDPRELAIQVKPAQFFTIDLSVLRNHRIEEYGYQILNRIEHQLPRAIFSNDENAEIYKKQWLRYKITNSSVNVDKQLVAIDELTGVVSLKQQTLTTNFWLNISIHDTNKHLLRSTFTITYFKDNLTKYDSEIDFNYQTTWNGHSMMYVAKLSGDKTVSCDLWNASTSMISLTRQCRLYINSEFWNLTRIDKIYLTARMSQLDSDHTFQFRNIVVNLKDTTPVDSAVFSYNLTSMFSGKLERVNLKMKRNYAEFIETETLKCSKQEIATCFFSSTGFNLTVDFKFAFYDNPLVTEIVLIESSTATLQLNLKNSRFELLVANRVTSWVWAEFSRAIQINRLSLLINLDSVSLDFNDLRQTYSIERDVNLAHLGLFTDKFVQINFNRKNSFEFKQIWLNNNRIEYLYIPVFLSSHVSELCSSSTKTVKNKVETLTTPSANKNDENALVSSTTLITDADPSADLSNKELFFFNFSVLILIASVVILVIFVAVLVIVYVREQRRCLQKRNQFNSKNRLELSLNNSCSLRNTSSISSESLPSQDLTHSVLAVKAGKTVGFVDLFSDLSCDQLKEMLVWTPSFNEYENFFHEFASFKNMI
jgi:hypothetical protein